jgi:hypothetical protein
MYDAGQVGTRGAQRAGRCFRDAGDGGQGRRCRQGAVDDDRGVCGQSGELCADGRAGTQHSAENRAGDAAGDTGVPAGCARTRQRRGSAGGVYLRADGLCLRDGLLDSRAAAGPVWVFDGGGHTPASCRNRNASSQPWLLAFLLRQDAGVWKLAGFYPRARTAGGHDGGWFWAQGYEAGKSKQLWLAWLYFSEADQLLRPANFVTSTKLDNLRAEQHTAAPPELANGVSPESPLVLKVGGVQYPVTDLEVASSADGQHLNLMLHVSVAAGDGSSTDTMAQARAVSVAQALIDAHVELRPAFQDVWVFAEATQQNPAVTVLKMAEIP